MPDASPPIQAICFMVMPYGRRATGVEPGKGPAEVDFDALWEQALRPMIEELQFVPVRADQDAGALIVPEMIQRLVVSQLVIADISVANANVYYELGLRHAAQNSGCVMIGADWAKPLFDVAQMRHIKYPLPEGAITADTAQKIRAALTEKVKAGIRGPSPVQESLPGFPDHIDPDRLRVLDEQRKDLHDLEGAVKAARALTGADRQAEADRLNLRYGAVLEQFPTVARELIGLLRDGGGWQATLEWIDRLPDAVRSSAPIREQRALALGKCGRNTEAIAELESLILSEGETAERRGLLGGRFKVLSDTAPDRDNRRRYLNSSIAAYERGMDLDLNYYYPSCNLPRLYRQRGDKGDEEKAAAAAAIAMRACERSRRLDPADSWAPPTLLGAAFDAGDVKAARRLFTELEQMGPEAFHLSSTIPDLRRSLNLTRTAKKAADLAGVLRDTQKLLRPRGTVVALAGRRVDAAGAPPRFPAANIGVVKQRLGNLLNGAAAEALVCAAACGADLLGLEAARELGIRRRVVLPFAREVFRETSVIDRGGDWGERFDAALDSLPAEDLVILGHTKDDPQAYPATNVAILDEAVRLADAGQQYPMAFVVWDGLPRGDDDVTLAFLKKAQERKIEPVTISTL